MVNNKLTLSKKERLNNKLAIESIVSEGNLVKAFPIFISYVISPSEEPKVQALFSVSKKKQKLAVNRNRIKRRLKEAYRINKLSLYEFSMKNELSIDLMVIQVTGDDIPFSRVQKRLVLALSKLLESELKKLEKK